MLTCALTDDNKSGNIVLNTCPITSGQSGSSLIETRTTPTGTQYYIRGVVSFEMCKSVCASKCCAGQTAYNGVVKITPFFQSFIDSHQHTRPFGGEDDTE
jgi:hypothetical protein